MTAPLRPLARLLVESVDAVDGPLDPALATASIDDVLRAGELHRVTPSIRRRVVAAGSAPEGWMPALDRARSAQLFRHMRAASDLRALGAGLGSSTRWAVAKGAVLSDLVWPHPDMREYTDIDAYVHPEDFEGALNALEAAGFTLLDRNWPELRRQMRSEVALRGPSGMTLDLHWHLVGDSAGRERVRPALPRMLERAAPSTLGSGVVVPVFDPTDAVLHVALHAARAGSNRLMWIGDLHHGSRRLEVDWDELDRRARAMRASAPIALTLGRVERVFGTDLPLSDGLRRYASRSAWARLAARADRARPFPGLPGDASLGGRVYSSARSTFAVSTADAARDALAVRRIEARVRRAGPQRNPLDDDVPDQEARRAYFAAVRTASAAR